MPRWPVRTTLTTDFEDLAVLFELLEEGRIDPIIEQRFPILEASAANALLESGTVTGNVIPLAPELL